MQTLGRLHVQHTLDAAPVERLGLLLAPAFGPVHPLYGKPNDLVRTGVLQTGCAVERCDRGAVALDGRPGLRLSLRVDEGRDGLGRGRQHRAPLVLAPRGEEPAV